MKKTLGLVTVAVLLGGAAALVVMRSRERVALQQQKGEDGHDHEKGHDGHDHGESAEIDLSEQAQKNANIRWSPAGETEWETGISATAVVSAPDSAVHHVRLLSRGRVVKLLIQLGDRVTEGAPLVVYENLDSNGLQNDLANARSALAVAESAASVSKSALTRAENLIELGAIPRAELERRAGEFRSAQERVAIERANVTKTGRLMERAGIRPGDLSPAPRTTLTSPFSGIVTALNAGAGELRDPSEDLLTLTATDHVWVLASVFERDIAAIRKNQNVPITVDAYPDRTFRGKVSYVADQVDPETRTIAVRCEVDNPDRLLKLGMFARVTLGAGTPRRVVVVPEQAVQTVDGQTVVYTREDDGHFRKTPVELGDRRSSLVEVRAGLQPGVNVVVSGSFALKAEAMKGSLHSHGEEEKD